MADRPKIIYWDTSAILSALFMDSHNAEPDWSIVSGLAQRTVLRGTDLWHLSLTTTLRRDLPELQMLTFDAKLHEAARREDLAMPLA